MIETRQSLLKDISYELRKNHPDRLCEAILTFSNPTQKALTDLTDKCRVEFALDGELVHVPYLVIGNSNGQNFIAVSIDEPLSTPNPALPASNGLLLDTGVFGSWSRFIIEASVQFIEIRLMQAGPYTIAVNNSLGNVPVDGIITVQGYVPQRKD